jgi:hypothetical protein
MLIGAMPPEAAMLRPIVLLALILGALLQTAAAQIGNFPGVMPPVPSPGAAPAPQPPIIYSPNLQGSTVAPNLMLPVTPVPYSTPLLRGSLYVHHHHGGHRVR